MAPVSKAKGAEDEEFIKVQKDVEDEEVSESDGDEEEEDSEEEDGEEAEVLEEAETGEAGTSKPKTKANRLREMQEKDDVEPAEPRGVIYIGHIPQGFFEPQMKTFFSQFGTITRIRLSRSKKNAALKGYGFIEFEEESVAKIVADTMHKYLLFGRQLVCHMIPAEKQHRLLFKGCKSRITNRSHLRRSDARALYNDRPTVANVDGSSAHQITRRQAERRNAKEKKLRLTMESFGIDFDANAASDGQRISARKPRKEVSKESDAILAATAAAVAATAKAAKSAVAAKSKSPKVVPAESPKAASTEVEDKKRKQVVDQAMPTKTGSKKAKRKVA